MKKCIYLLTVAVILLINACKKGDDTPANPFAGRWKLVAQKMSMGGPQVWYDVDPKDNYYAQFYNSGKFESNSFMTDGYTNYSFKDSLTLVLTKDNEVQNFGYTFIKPDTMTLYPKGPILCIEGCTFKFARQR